MLSALLLALAAVPVELDFEGSIDEALEEIARAGQLNVVVLGDLDDGSEVKLRLHGVDAEQAIQSLARAHGLRVQKDGALFLVRGPGSDAPSSFSLEPPAPPQPPAAPLPPQPPSPPTRASKDGEEPPTVDDDGDLVGAGVTVPAGKRVHSVVSWWGPVTLEPGARVEGDAVAVGGDLVMEAGSRINGDAVAVFGRVVRHEGTRVGGEVVSIGKAGDKPALNPALASASGLKAPSSFSLVRTLALFGLLFGVGFVLAVFAPTRWRRLESAVRHESLRSGLFGLLVLLGSVPLTVFLAVTVIGIPIAVLWWLFLGLVTLAGMAAVAAALGSLLPHSGAPALTLAIGAGALALLVQIPGLGVLATLGGVLVAVGAVLRTRLGAGAPGLPVADLSREPSIS